MKMYSFNEILNKPHLKKEDIIRLLNADGEEKDLLFKHASEVKKRSVGERVFLRGLIEYSNICKKDCYYCGIRSSNNDVCRYEMTLEEIRTACEYAVEKRFGSMVLQCGELRSERFTKKITEAIKEIKKISPEMRITLSCGEQSPDVYKQWYDAGAERYLLRIETSNSWLYGKIHPQDAIHNYSDRIRSVMELKKQGFQTGTGVMIGLPYQTIEHLAGDIIFMKEMDIDMVGMGPYIEHDATPMFKHSNKLMPLQQRYELALKMIAVLRIVMKDINIASTTALQTINPNGKRSALEIGANVIMPNITPSKYKSYYNLYENKPGGNYSLDAELEFSVNEIKKANCITAFGEKGDALHFSNK